MSMTMPMPMRCTNKAGISSCHPVLKPTDQASLLRMQRCGWPLGTSQHHICAVLYTPWAAGYLSKPPAYLDTTTTYYLLATDQLIGHGACAEYEETHPGEPSTGRGDPLWTKPPDDDNNMASLYRA
ncbi:hypothetical protein H101_08024 [Trichophyton interdigitale H6]|nr:hypothetical protein H101_08024 [Trichophyton interdigitale H6]